MTEQQRNRIIKMLAYSATIGLGAGFTAFSQGIPRQPAIAMGIAAFWTNLGAYWASSPKSPDKPTGGDDGTGS